MNTMNAWTKSFGSLLLIGSLIGCASGNLQNHPNPDRLPQGSSGNGDKAALILEKQLLSGNREVTLSGHTSKEGEVCLVKMEKMEAPAQEDSFFASVSLKNDVSSTGGPSISLRDSRGHAIPVKKFESSPGQLTLVTHHQKMSNDDWSFDETLNVELEDGKPKVVEISTGKYGPYGMRSVPASSIRLKCFIE